MPPTANARWWRDAAFQEAKRLGSCVGFQDHTFLASGEAANPAPAGARTDHRPPAAQGGAPPKAAAGGARRGERSPGAPDSARAERRPREPQGRGRTGPRPNATKREFC